MTGIMSQALANVQQVEAQIKALSGLPPAAQQVQQQAVALVDADVPEITALQAKIVAFSQQASTSLSQVEAILSGSQPLANAKAIMSQVQAGSSDVGSQIAAIGDKLRATSDQLAAFGNTLQAAISQVGGEMASLTAQLDNARQEEDAANKKKYLLIALGPLGVAALPAIIALAVKWSNDVQSLQAQESALTAQIASHRLMITAIKQLSSDFGSLFTRVRDVQNVTTLLSGDIGNVVQDLTEGSAQRVVIEALVKAALGEVQTLAQDAA